jgi:hypothetical protein
MSVVISSSIMYLQQQLMNIGANEVWKIAKRTFGKYFYLISALV